jgi:hypothetical protein
MACSFKYQPLDAPDQEIRLVEILSPNSDRPGTSLSVKHVTLSESPRYWILSYTWNAPFDGLPPEWDDPNATHTVYLDDYEFEVR